MTKENNKPLHANFLAERDVVVKNLQKYDGVLQDRITYIAKCICDAFDCKFFTWYFPYAAELPTHLQWSHGRLALNEFGNKEFFNIVIEKSVDRRKKNNVYFIVLLNGEEWELFDIPTRWLTEDFEKELKDGRAAFLQKLEDEKKVLQEKAAKKKEEKMALLKSLKKKLTPTELRLLNLDEK